MTWLSQLAFHHMIMNNFWIFRKACVYSNRTRSLACAGITTKKYSTIKILPFLFRVRAGNCDSSKGVAYFLISAHYCPSVYVFVRLSFTNTWSETSFHYTYCNIAVKEWYTGEMSCTCQNYKSLCWDDS